VVVVVAVRQPALYVSLPGQPLAALQSAHVSFVYIKVYHKISPTVTRKATYEAVAVASLDIYVLDGC
jgi:hypothetical protein